MLKISIRKTSFNTLVKLLPYFPGSMSQLSFQWNCCNGLWCHFQCLYSVGWNPGRVIDCEQRGVSSFADSAFYKWIKPADNNGSISPNQYRINHHRIDSTYAGITSYVIKCLEENKYTFPILQYAIPRRWFDGPLDDVIKWKHFPRNWPFVRGIHRSPVNFPHKGQWRGAFMFSLICVWINDWVEMGNDAWQPLLGYYPGTRHPYQVTLTY